VTRHAYPAARNVAARATDLLLIAVALWLLIARSGGRLGIALGLAIPLVLAWGVLTLHYPRAVTIDDRGISFEGYGRSHRFEWSDVRAIRVRKFLVGDRVLVRVLPSAPWRGRYWILESLEGYRELLAALQRQAREHEVLPSPRPSPEGRGGRVV